MYLFNGKFSDIGRTPLVGTVGTVGSLTSETYWLIVDNHILAFMYDTHDEPATFLLQKTTARRTEQKLSLTIYRMRKLQNEIAGTKPGYECDWKYFGINEKEIK